MLLVWMIAVAVAVPVVLMVFWHDMHDALLALGQRVGVLRALMDGADDDAWW